MAQWQRAGLDKSVAHANAPCGGVAVAGSSMTMRRRETLRWRWRPDRSTVQWRRAAQMLGPLLGHVAIHSWRQGGTAWSLLVAREKPTAGMCRKHRTGKVWRFLQNRPGLGFGSFPKTAPSEDSRRMRGDIRVIASGRSKYLQVVAAVGWSSMYLFRFCPYGPSSLISALGVV